MKIETVREQFLGFWLTTDLQAVTSTASVGEVLNLDISNIVPLPDIAYMVMGMYNHRGDVLWIMDLPCLLGLKPLHLSGSRHHCSILVMHFQQQTMGFAVPKVGQILSPQKHRIQLSFAKQKTQQLDWCVQGTCTGADNTSMVILSSEKIFDLLKL